MKHVKCPCKDSISKFSWIKELIFFLQNNKNIKWKYKRMFILESLVGNVLFRKNVKIQNH